jgi:nucleolin
MGKKSKAAAPSRDVKSSKALSSVKSGSVVKSSQTPKSKSKEMAKKAAAMLEQDKKKSKQIKKKEPSPSSDSSDESMSDDATQKNGKVTAKPAAKLPVNGNAKAMKEASDDDTSPSSSSTSASSDSESASESESEVEAKSKPTSKPKQKIESPSDSESESGSDSADEKPSSAKAGTNTGAKNAAPAKEESSETDTDSESDDEDADAGKPKKAAPNGKPATVNGTAKNNKAKVESDEDEDDSEDESASGTSEDDTSDSDVSSDEEEEEVSQEKPNVKKRAAEDSKELPAKKVKAENTTNVNEAEGQKNLFVGNLSWNVDEEWLSREFGEFGELTGVRIINDRNTGRSKGFGYVEFANAADAAAALKAKNKSELDGRAINVDFSTPRPNEGERSNARAKAHGDTTSPESDTLFVGNISFEANEDILGEEFGKWGTVTQVRLPTDMGTGAPKGYGYVQFASVEEAKEAMKNMTGAPICGRPVRLDFSTPKQNNGDSRGGYRPQRGGRGGFGDRGGRGGMRGGRGGFGDRGGRGGRGGGRGASTNRGGFGDFKGQKKTFE